MTEYVNEANLNEYEAFISAHPKGHFMQSRVWGYQKSSWEWAAVISRGQDGKIRGSCAVLIRKPLPVMPYTLMYACRGPVCDITDEETVRELIEALRKLAREKHAYQIKIDPDIPVAITPEILSEMEPEVNREDDTELIKQSERFKEIMLSEGYKHTGGGKNFDGVQPRFVFRLNVEGKTEDELLNAFHSKTRYNLRLSVRKGVEVKLCGKEAVPDFSRLMNDTGERDGFAVRPESYFSSMLDCLGEHARLYMAYHEGKAIAGTLAIQYGDKVWYLYGASANEYRNLMPNYQLQWEMIRWAVETNCRVYDFRGISGDISESNPLYGLYKFKKGFSGKFTEFIGEFDLDVNPAVSSLVKAGNKLLRGR